MKEFNMTDSDIEELAIKIIDSLPDIKNNPSQASKYVRQCLVDFKYQLLDCVDDIEHNSESIGCGLEDRGIIDRYEAAHYGFEECKKQILEVL